MQAGSHGFGSGASVIDRGHGLGAFAVLHKSLCEVDARGGIFRQQHVEEAFGRAVERASLREVLIGFAQTVPCSVADLTSQICYKLRVMMAHVRLKYDACGSAPSVLDPIFDVMRKPTSYRKARREERMRKVNPYTFSGCPPRRSTTFA